VASWDGNRTLTITLASTGAVIAGYSGASLAVLTAALAGFAAGDTSGAAGAYGPLGGLPLPSGAPASGQVPVATGTGEASAWAVPPGGVPSGAAGGDLGGTYPNPTVAKIQGTAISAPPGGTTQFLRGDGTWQVPADVDAFVASVTAADASAAVGGTATAPTVASGTLDQVANLHPPAANWSNNGKKITSVANGSAAQDVAAFGQIPAALPPNGAAGGDLGGTYPNPTALKTNGTAFGTAATAAIDTTAADIAALGTQAAGSTGKVADAGHVHPTTGVMLSSLMTTLGDILYENATPAPARLAGSISATKNFLTQTGTGAVSAAPAWGTIAAADLPAASTSTQGAVILDGTAADIAIPGAQAAGAIGKAADAGHIHPAPGLWLPSDNGLLAASGSLPSAGTGLVTVAQNLYLIKIWIRSAFTASNLWLICSTAGAGASTQSFAGLWNSAGTLLTGSADIGATFTSTGAKSVPFTTPQALTTGMSWVWAGFVFNLATTQPALRQIAGGSPPVMNLNLAAASFAVAVNGTTITALANITPSANSQGGNAAPFWAGIS
jgi:hypothetical protein